MSLLYLYVIISKKFIKFIKRLHKIILCFTKKINLLAIVVFNFLFLKRTKFFYIFLL